AKHGHRIALDSKRTLDRVKLEEEFCKFEWWSAERKCDRLRRNRPGMGGRISRRGCGTCQYRHRSCEVFGSISIERLTSQKTPNRRRNFSRTSAEFLPAAQVGGSTRRLPRARQGACQLEAAAVDPKPPTVEGIRKRCTKAKPCYRSTLAARPVSCGEC